MCQKRSRKSRLEIKIRRSVKGWEKMQQQQQQRLQRAAGSPDSGAHVVLKLSNYVQGWEITYIYTNIKDLFVLE